ncbi:UNVERIFIED_ORG: protein-S-isoprenylcysteine O-methyltransferase Ste14 [Mycolicibacterium obuense]
MDSLWGLAALVPGGLALRIRILDEEQLLREQLDGYDDYTRQVRYRLFPAVW